MFVTNLDTIQLSRLNSWPLTLTRRAYVHGFATLIGLPVISLLTHLAKTSSCIVLTVNTQPPSTLYARARVSVQGFIVNTTVSVIITLALDAWEGIVSVATLKWFVVVQWLTAITLEQ